MIDKVIKKDQNHDNEVFPGPWDWPYLRVAYTHQTRIMFKRSPSQKIQDKELWLCLIT